MEMFSSENKYMFLKEFMLLRVQTFDRLDK